MAFNPMAPVYLAVGVGDSSVKIFDRRRLRIGPKAPVSEGKRNNIIKRNIMLPVTMYVYKYDRSNAWTSERAGCA